ncbi:MAG: response regulator [Elusimicrobiota bacterium]|jgi:DNA-binding response OmpR family regulator
MFDRLFGKKQTRILVADDDYMVRSLVSDVLKTQGYEVDTVEDGLEAINSVRKNPYDLVILDVHMPRMEGTEALEVIRLMPEGKKLGVIMLTSDNLAGTLIKSYELGAISYMPKPFSSAQLIGKVRAYLENKKKPQAGKGPTSG